MAAYLALSWTGEAPPLAREVIASLPQGGRWRLAREAADQAVFVRGPNPPRIRTLPCDRGVVIGDLYRRSFRSTIGDEVESVMVSRAATVEAIARDLRDGCWGRYVAVIREADGRSSVFRDPSGALEAMCWSRDGVSFVGSHLPDWVTRQAWPTDLALDWSQIAKWLRFSSAIGASSALTGLTAVTPGALRRSDGELIQLWSAGAAARQAEAGGSDSGRNLVEIVDACLMKLVEGETLLAEVSGGLDSAIVAGGLALHARDQVAQWTNYYVADRPGDERRYARQVARRWKVLLTEVPKPDFAVTEAMLDAVADGLRPGVSAKDAVRDRETGERAQSLGATRIVTGQGGDMVFFATPTPLLVVDHLRRTGPIGIGAPYVVDVARWTRRSVWNTPGWKWREELLAHNRPVADHPWLADCVDLPPAKQIQVATLAHKVIVHIDGLRGRVAEVIHPLMAQPVVEHCLAIPTPDLTVGGRDRGLARQAFAARLPPAIRHRRSKGELGAYYGRVVAASLDMLRRLLLDGRLVQMGLLDRRVLEPMLTRDHLIWRGDYSALMSMAVVEAWVRHWERRLG